MGQSAPTDATQQRMTSGDGVVPRSFATLLGAFGLSNLADGVLKVVLPLAAVTFSRSPGVVAGVEIVRSLPWLVLALPAGAYTDRWDRRRTMLAANLGRAVMVGIAAAVVAGGHGSIAVLYLAAIGTGVAEVFHDTAAQTVLPQVVGRNELSRANGRLQAVELTAQQFIGPPLAGVVVAVGLAAGVGLPAALWAVSLLVLWRLRGNFRAGLDPTQPTTIRRDIGEGLRFVVSNRLLLRLAVMVAISNLTLSATGSVLVLYAVGDESTLGLDERGFTLLFLALAAGALCAALAVGRIEAAVGRARVLAASLLGVFVFLATPALADDVAVVAAAAVIGGFGVELWNVPTVSFRQRVTPDRLLGRVNSTYRLLAWGTMPIGAALGGLVGEIAGVRSVFAAASGLFLLQFVLGARITEDGLLKAEEAAEASAGEEPRLSRR
ncbi:MAG: MFS transporter [Actinomycetota bacterium]|nr:MFS transporter [Actinomycetota bacterium]